MRICICKTLEPMNPASSFLDKNLLFGNIESMSLEYMTLEYLSLEAFIFQSRIYLKSTILESAMKEPICLSTSYRTTAYRYKTVILECFTVDTAILQKHSIKYLHFASLSTAQQIVILFALTLSLYTCLCLI